MTPNEQRVYRMSLAQFHQYLRDKRDELDACRGEIDEIQAKFRQVFNDELAAWQTLFSFCYPRIKEGRKELPADFRAYLDRVEAEETARINAEIATLDQEVAEKRRTGDGVTAQAQAAAQAMRAANPQLNEQEEALKARVAQLQQEFTRAYEEEEALDARALGWLRHGGRIARLRRLQKTTKQQQNRALTELRRVRKAWVDTVQSTGEVESTLRAEWQQTGVQAAQSQARHDYLQDHLAELAEEAALQRALQELSQPTSVPGELGDKLKELAQHNVVRKSYEDGLAAVAEALGLLKGISTGLEKFADSVGKVVAEQRRYNLKDVKVDVAQLAADVNGIWVPLRAQVKNEDYMGSNPLEFVRIVQQSISARLTNEVIKTFFEGMGEALNKATKAWG